MSDAFTDSTRGVALRLLGRPRVTWPGGEEELGVGLPLRLLVYLALTDGWIGRERIGALFWPDLDLERRQGNVRRVLGRARSFPWAAGVEADRSRIRWVIPTDVSAFDRPDLGAAERLALWRGPLFEGIEVEEDEPFGQWLSEERRRLDGRWRTLTLQRAEELDQEGRFEQATGLLVVALERDPLDEEALQRLMLVSANAGRVTQGRSAYRRFADDLDRELGLAPLESTRQLLEALDGMGRVAPSVAAPAPRDARPLPDPPLVGREGAMARALASGAALLLVSGEAGVGKTRLARSLVGGRQALWLRGVAAQRTTPFAAVAAALRTVAADPDAAVRMQGIPSSMTTSLSELIEGSAQRPSQVPVASALAEQRARLVEAACAALRALAAGGVVLVDDLHDLDSASLEVVLRLARTRSATGGPGLVATARSYELTDAPEAGRALAGLRSEGLLHREEIAPLSEGDVRAMVEGMSGRPGGRLFARRLHGATGGNPLYVLETIRFLFDAGLLSEDADGGWSTPYDDETEDYAELPIPPTVREAVSERVVRLGDASRRVLEAASLAVAPFTLEQLAPATALSEWLAMEGLERAVEAGLVVPEAEAYRFAHDLLRRSVADGLGSERRALIERRLAWSLERERGSPALIAAHFDRAGRRADALRWHRRAAEDAVRLFVPSIALEHLERAAELAEHDADRVEVALQRAELLDHTVDLRGRGAVLDSAVEAAERLGDLRLKVRVALARAEYAGDRGRLEEATAEVRKALAAGALGEDAARAHLVIARLNLTTGALLAAEAALTEAMEALPPGPSALRGQIHLIGLFKAAFTRRDVAAALRHVESAIASFEAVGRRDLLAEALNYQGLMLLIQTGDRPRAIAQLEAGLAIAREMGLVSVQRRSILNLVKIHTDIADVEAAAPLIDEGLALSHDFETAATEVAFLQAVGYVRYLQGDLGAARRAWDRAQEVADSDSSVVYKVFTRSVPLLTYLRSGDVERSRLLLEEARELVRAHAQGHLEPRMSVLAARMEVAEGSPAKALDLLAPWQARDDLPSEERGELGLALALAHAAAGEDEAALAALGHCEGAPTIEVVLGALALRLKLLLRLGRPWREAADEARTRLNAGRLTPFEAVDLMLALAAAEEADGEQETARVLRAEAASRKELLLRDATSRAATSSAG